MNTSLTQFKVVGLHGTRQEITLSIRDNRLVLVGENGTGKSTVVNLLYYVLTQQWPRLAEFSFSEIQATADFEEVRFTHDDVQKLAEARHPGSISRELAIRFPRHILHEFSRELGSIWLDEDLEEDVIHRFSAEHGVPPSIARRMLADLRENQRLKLKGPLAATVKRLASWKFGQFLYLPTYRRIEQDLKSIFRGIEIEEKVRDFRERFRKRERSTFVELIEFGMEDVERTIQARMGQIRESVRNGLSKLTGTYLREVIRGVQDNPDISVLRTVERSGFQSMFARIDEAILPAVDKALVQQKIEEISKSYSVGPEDDRAH